MCFLMCLGGGHREGLKQQGAWVGRESDAGCKVCKDAWQEQWKLFKKDDFKKMKAGKAKRKRREAIKKKRWNKCAKCRASKKKKKKGGDDEDSDAASDASGDEGGASGGGGGGGGDKKEKVGNEVLTRGFESGFEEGFKEGFISAISG